MNENNTPAMICIDIKKYRIRIFKSTLRDLGNPHYVQLLINPESLSFAIKAVDHEFRGDQTHKVTRFFNSSEISVDIYSRTFVSMLLDIVPQLSQGHSYRLEGLILPETRIALFSLSTMIPLDEQGDDNE